MSLLLPLSHLQYLCFLPPKLRYRLLRDLGSWEYSSAKSHRKGSTETEASSYFGPSELHMLVVDWQTKEGITVLVGIIYTGYHNKLGLLPHNGDKEDYDQNLSGFQTSCCFIAQ